MYIYIARCHRLPSDRTRLVKFGLTSLLVSGWFFRASHEAVMSSHIRPRLTTGEISGLIRAFPFIASTIVAFIWTSSWSQWRNGNFGGKTLRRNAVASIGTAISLLSPRQIRALFAHTTGESIRRYCAAHELSHQSALVKNEDGFPPATLHFVNCEMAQNGPILLYFQYVLLHRHCLASTDSSVVEGVL